MIEVKRDDFFIESIKNPIEYGTYYKINPKYGTGFQWTNEVHYDFIITVTDIRFNQETMVGEHIGSGYVLALYISGAGDEFYPYQIVSPNTLRCYEPSEKYKAIYHPQIPLRFKSVYNMSITEYIQRKRISVAEHMLIQTDLTIAEISKIVGYSNPSRLIEIFKRYYGFTPSKYRG